MPQKLEISPLFNYVHTAKQKNKLMSNSILDEIIAHKRKQLAETLPALPLLELQNRFVQRHEAVLAPRG